MWSSTQTWGYRYQCGGIDIPTYLQFRWDRRSAGQHGLKRGNRALEAAHCESDWKRPKPANGAKWRSKVNWAYAEEFLDLGKQGLTDVTAADDEVAEKLKRKAAIAKHLGGSAEASGRGGAGE